MLASEGEATHFALGRTSPGLRLLQGLLWPHPPVGSFLARRDHAARRFDDEARGCRLHLHREEDEGPGLSGRWFARTRWVGPPSGPPSGLELWLDRLATTPSFDLTRPSPADWTLISAVRRMPAVAAAVTAGYVRSTRRPGLPADPGAERVIALLYGVAGADGDLAAVLEETRNSRGTKFLAVCRPAGQADRILEARHDLDDDGAAVVSVHVFIPGPAMPRRVQLALFSGVARMSSDGQTWARSVPEDEWAELFEAAVTPGGH